MELPASARSTSFLILRMRQQIKANFPAQLMDCKILMPTLHERAQETICASWHKPSISSYAYFSWKGLLLNSVLYLSNEH